MKYSIFTLLAVTALGTTVAVAQDGSGRGPPKSPTPIITAPQPAPGSTILGPKVPVPKLSQSKLELPLGTK
jgi:hypothetical protein